MNIRITYINTATIIIDINGYRLITDPVFDEAGHTYHFGFGTISKKTENPAFQMDEIGNIDMVLLSHHQHEDNLDIKGKEFIKSVKEVISTKSAAKKFSNVIGLDDWESIHIVTDKVKGLKITAVPAQHHPWWLPEFFSGKVIGFIIECEEQDDGVIYISGDTVYFSGIEKIAKKYKIETAIIHVGSAQFRYLTGFGRYTFNAKEAIKAVELLKPTKVIPIHYDGWTHFKEKINVAKKHFQSSSINEKVIWLEKGKETLL